MDPAAFGNFYSPFATAIPPGMRYPYPPTPATPGTTTPGARSMIFYPQPILPEAPSQDVSEASASASDEPPQKRPADKKLRRQIANSNERRRMQSINAGFHTLRLLMPHLQGEKMSKAAVLQHAAEHIFRLNQERERLAQQNATLRMMVSKYWSMEGKGEVTEAKVSKATSPIVVDDEKAAAKELEQIFATRHELDVVKEELERERALRIRAEANNRALQERLMSEEDEDDTEDTSDLECFGSQKRPRLTPEPRNNLDVIVRAIRQIEGDAFSRSATPTCATQERTTLSGFVPITTSTDSSRMSPITPVYAS